MSNAPYTPPPGGTVPPPAGLDYGDLQGTGVRRILDAEDRRGRQWTRWGGIFAGVFTALGLNVLLSTLGIAFGISSLNPRGTNPGENLGVGAAVWWGIQALLTLGIGGYAAAKLSGAIRRSDGVMNGFLTWSLCTIASVWLLGAVLSSAVQGAAGAAQAAAATPPAQAAATQAQGQAQRLAQGAATAAARAQGPAAGVAWYTFAIMAGSLLTAIGGGAAGAAYKHERVERGGGGVITLERGGREEIRRAG